MTPAEREFVVRQLDQTTDRLRDVLQGLSREQLLYKADPESWSIAEAVEHMVVVEKRLIGAIQKLIQEPSDHSKQNAMDDTEVLRQVGTVVEKVQSPAHSVPKLRWPAEDLLKEFEAARQITREFARSVDGDLRQHFITHFKLGELDCYQWLLLIGAHCKRHTEQSEAVKASMGFAQ
jgi:uncharacterized damage-inducible protein DinB